MRVAVDASLEQPVTNLTRVINSTNAYGQNTSHY